MSWNGDKEWSMYAPSTSGVAFGAQPAIPVAMQDFAAGPAFDYAQNFAPGPAYNYQMPMQSFAPGPALDYQTPTLQHTTLGSYTAAFNSANLSTPALAPDGAWPNNFIAHRPHPQSLTADPSFTAAPDPGGAITIPLPQPRRTRMEPGITSSLPLLIRL